MTDFALAILKYIYLVVLWGFVLLAIGLIRRDIFINRRLTSNSGSNSGDNIAKTSVNASTLSATATPPISQLQDAKPNFSAAGRSLLAEAQTDLHTVEPINILPLELVILRGIASGDTFSLDGFEVTIGRDNTSTVALPDNFVSTQHARIFLHNGAYFIEDLHSTNGTVVDNHKITGVTELSRGSRIAIGNNMLELQ